MRPTWWSVQEHSADGPWACMADMHEDQSTAHSLNALRRRQTASHLAAKSVVASTGVVDASEAPEVRNKDKGATLEESVTSSSSSIPSTEAGSEYDDLGDSEEANEDQWLWGAGVMITPILAPGTFSRKVKIPEGSSWMCWQGCPQGVQSHPSIHSEGDVSSGIGDRRHFQPASGRQRGGVLHQRHRGDTNTAKGAQGVQESPQGGKQGQIGAAGSVVLVRGVEIDMVPVWLRFGSIVPMSSLFSPDRRVSAVSLSSRSVENADCDHLMQHGVALDTAFPPRRSSSNNWSGCSAIRTTRTSDVFTSSRNSRHRNNKSSSSRAEEAGGWDHDQGFQFEVATAQEALQAPVDLFVMLGQTFEEQGVHPDRLCSVQSLPV